MKALTTIVFAVGGIYLIATGHPGWGCFCLVFAMLTV